MLELYSQVINFPQSHKYRMDTLTFGINVLDRLVGELKGGDFVVFHCSRLCHVFSELLCVHCQLPQVKGGFKSSAIFIDGGNLFDHYLISEKARLSGLEPKDALKNIWVSRAFTGYQLTTLITEKLPLILDREGSRLVLVSNIAMLYCDPDIRIIEATVTFDRIICFLKNLAKERDFLLVLTSIFSRNRRKRQLEQYLQERSDITMKISDGNPHVKLDLEKHPSKPAVSVNMFLEESRKQSSIRDFIDR